MISLDQHSFELWVPTEINPDNYYIWHFETLESAEDYKSALQPSGTIKVNGNPKIEPNNAAMRRPRG